MKKNRVLLVSPYSKKKVGGIGTWTKNIIDYHKASRDYNLFFLNTAFKFKPNLIKNQFQRVLVGVFDSAYLIILFIIKTILYKPNTVHYTSSGSIALIKDYVVVRWASLIGINFVIHWRFGRISELSKTQSFEWKMLLRVAKLVNTSIVLDQKSLEVFKSVGIDNVRLIPNPISKDLKILANTINFESKKLQYNTILYVGHIIPAKGIRELIEAFCDIDRKVNLVMVGPVNGEFKEEIMFYTSRFNKSELIKWTGEIPREEVYKYFSSSKVLCLPSYTEGFPNVVIEAMALGCPVIATNVGAIEEMIISSDLGPAGICIEPKNIDQLKKAIESILIDHNKYLMYGKNGNKRVLSKYTLDNIFPQYEKLWE